MQYNVAQLLKEPTGATRRVQVGSESERLEGAPINYTGSVQLLRTHQGLLVRGQVDAGMRLTCSRCLSEFVCSCTLDVEEEFLPLVDVTTGRRLTLTDEAEGTVLEGTIIDTSHVLDLTEVLRQYSIASQPIKPLCQKGCSGLCQECGADLNKEACQCSGSAIDPRWGALAALLNESETRKDI